MSAITLFDLLGVPDVHAAAVLWPSDFLPVEPEPMLAELQGALEFDNIVPGASGGAVGLWADMIVGLTISRPLVFASLAKFEFRLLDTSGGPARIFVQRTGLGVELVLEELPVEITFPDGLLAPFDPNAGDVVQGAFSPAFPDTWEVALNAVTSSTLKAFVKLKVSETFDFLFEFATPISLGPCRFSGIPCAAVHDLSLILTPNPTGMDARAQPLEWLRHPLNVAPGAGGIAVRTLDLFSPGSRIANLTAQANTARALDVVEPVLEDLVLVPQAPPSPFPVHFSAGVRRNLGPTDDPNGIYRLGDKPVIVTFLEESAPGQGGGVYLIVREALIRSFADGTSLVDPQTAFLDIAISDDPAAQGFSGTVELSEEWTLTAGFHLEPAFKLFTLFNVTVKGMGARAGASFKRLFDAKPDADWYEPFVLLGDLVMVLGSEGEANASPGPPPVTLDSKSGKPTTIVVNGIGLKFGSFEMGNFWQADKLDLKAAGKIRLAVDEFGFVSEPNGGRYFSVTGSWPLFGTPSAKPPSATPAAPPEDSSSGIRFYRLRWKIHGDDHAPPFLIDGLGLSISVGSLSISGSGMISDRRDGNTRFVEVAFGVELSLGFGPKEQGQVFKAGAQFLHGHATIFDPANPFAVQDEYTYILASLAVSPIPLFGAVSLVNLRGLFAWNMAPNLGPADASAAQPMRLFEWSRAHAGVTDVPATRNVAATGWRPAEGSWAFAAGAGVMFGGSNAITIDAFFLYLHSPGTRGFLAALQIYLGGKKPIAYGVVEVEGEHWSVLIGLALGVKQATGKELPSFFDIAPSLTGTFYATNQPCTYAIGRLNDTSSWLALRMGGSLWVFKLKLFVGMCLEIVDVPDGPHVLALRAEFSGGSKLCSIGSIDFSLSMQLTIGVWRSESRVSGFIQTLEGSIRINVFYVFRFGASFKLEWAFLGPDPAYRQLTCQVKIHTPWWMPDKTFTWNRTFGQPALEQMATASTPLVSAAGHAVAPGDPIALPVSELSSDPQAVFDIAQLQALGAPALPGDAPLVPIDAVIALQFKPAVDDKLIWGQVTPPGASLQDSNDVSTRYELVELGIRRRPLSGPSAAAWTQLLDPANSRTDDIANIPPATLAQMAKSPLAMRWDADFQRADTLDPRVLLLNSELPWRFMIANFLHDENLVRMMPGWPCCPTFDAASEHLLTWQADPVGARAPLIRPFTNSTTTWRWVVTPPLVVAPHVPGGLPFVRLPVIGTPEGELARIVFDAPAASVSFDLNWKAMHLPRELVISAFHGLKMVAERVLPLSQTSFGELTLDAPEGFDSLILRLTRRPVPDSAGVTGSVELSAVRYTGRQELLDGLLHQLQCGSYDPTTAGNGSRFAWLPNHEYEVALKTRVSVAHTTAGALQTEVQQIMRFRTKGLLGLSATDRIGSEIEPYVESAYPPPGMCLYRSEPALLAFDERFDILQRIDHPTVPGDPAERSQRVDWELAARLTGERGNGLRISASSTDWIVAHRGAGHNVAPHPPVVGGTRQIIRAAVTLDPIRLRYEAIAVTAPACSPPPTHLSRVLSHPPADPRSDGSDPALWPALGHVRMALRVAGAPFVDRVAFEPDDASTFTTRPAPWAVTDGALAPTGTSGTQRAQFGEPGWLHYEVQLRIAALGTRAGLELAVTATDALTVWIDATGLHIVARHGAQETALATTSVSGAAPMTLSVTAYDDEIVASVGTARVSVPRGDRREGPLALLAEGAAAFTSLRVDGLDAWRAEFDVSRFEDFAAHVASFSGTVRRLAALGTPSATVAELVARGAPFAEWVPALGIALQQDLEALDIGQHASGVLVIESPEPFGGDLRITVRQGGSDVPAKILSDARGTAFLIVPDAPLAGNIELAFAISLQRFRSASVDDTSQLAQSHTLAFEL